MEFNNGDFTYLFLNELSEHSDDWNQLCGGNKYWSQEYMTTLTEFPPSGVKSFFCLVYKDKKPIGKFLFQYLHIKLKESFGTPSGEQEKRGFIVEKLRQLVLPFLNFKLVVNGNLLLSGSYGFKFSKDLEIDVRKSVFELANNYLPKYLKSQGVKPRGILLKDLDNAGGNLDQFLFDRKFSHFKVQPKMKFIVKEGWESIDDYLAAIKSKYRVRFRKAKKNLGTIEKRHLTDEEISRYSDQMFALYKQTVSKAGFNLFILDKNYFGDLAKKFPKCFRVTGLFLGEEMISFYTLMDNGQELDAHYLGYKLALNGKTQAIPKYALFYA